MASYNGQNFTTFTAVNTRGTIALRFAADVSGNESTLSVKPSLDGPRAWQFPDKSGTFGVTGTFSVDIPIIAASGYQSTVVTVAGIRAEDGLVVSPQNNGANGLLSARGAAVVAEALPGNGNITLTLVNALATATIWRTAIYSFTTVR